MAAGPLDLFNTVLGQSTNANTFQSGTKTSKKNISQEGINKLIYDVLSSDQGLAALGGVENASGGFKSSTKSLLSQDLITKIVGELANVTAETTETATGGGSTKNRSALPVVGDTVICTELVRQNRLDADLYSAGHAHFVTLPERTIRGYRVWAEKVVPLLQKYSFLAELVTPIAQGRYQYIVLGKPCFWGYFTVFIAQPICYLIGMCLKENKIAVITE